MAKQAKPIIHGRDHERGGADPVRLAWEMAGDATPGEAGIDLSRFVIAEVYGLKHLWAGGHGPISSGLSGMTTLACPIAGVPTPAPFNAVLYDRTVIPTLSFSSAAPRNVGLSFQAIDPAVSVYGVQLYRAAGAGTVTVRLWKSDAPSTILASGSDTAVGPGWNEIYFTAPFGPLDVGLSDRYVVAWHNDTAGDHKEGSPASDLPLQTEPPIIAQTAASDVAPWRRQLSDDGTMPGLATTSDFLVGPIFQAASAVPPLYIVATAAEGTDAGVHVVRTTYSAEEIQVYWSDPSVTVAVHVLALGGE